MPILDQEIIHVSLSRSELLNCIENARGILCALQERNDLHARDELERFEDLLMGEAAERMVIQWLLSNHKKAVSAVDKSSRAPGGEHDIWVQDTKGKARKGSVKSSISAYKTTPDDILDTYTLAVNEQEARDINVQVYFWLNTKNSRGSQCLPCATPPSLPGAPRKISPK